MQVKVGNDIYDSEDMPIVISGTRDEMMRIGFALWDTNAIPVFTIYRNSISSPYVSLKRQGELKKLVIAGLARMGQPPVPMIYGDEDAQFTQITTGTDVACKKCGQPFHPKTTAKYCDRPSSENPEKSCKKQAEYERQQELIRDNDAKRIYKSVYTSLRNRVDKETMDAFMAEARIWRAKVSSGEVSTEEYIEWLRSHQTRRVR